MVHKLFIQSWKQKKKKTEEKENEWAVKEWWLTFTIFNTYGFFVR